MPEFGMASTQSPMERFMMPRVNETPCYRYDKAALERLGIIPGVQAFGPLRYSLAKILTDAAISPDINEDGIIEELVAHDGDWHERRRQWVLEAQENREYALSLRPGSEKEERQKPCYACHEISLHRRRARAGQPLRQTINI
jgi:hypothetical protein